MCPDFFNKDRQSYQTEMTTAGFMVSSHTTAISSRTSSSANEKSMIKTHVCKKNRGKTKSPTFYLPLLSTSIQKKTQKTFCII